ncbi:hypothetical protein [Anaerosporobacter faecicola]|uniref:hypothetical protein n=1 Tax=Anaerosporobacter faecicola TaxID=2718714 RepID=UPI00143B5B89|nr:hypothetical protein [Anaerosporobacter faecicola]
MNWSRMILDGIVVALVFNLTVGMFWLIMPNAYSSMLPKEIKNAAPKREKKEVALLASILYPLYILIFAYMIASAYQAGITGFWNMFWMGYIEMMFVNIGDFFGLDWFFRKKLKDKIMITGTEHCKAWETKEWMKTLAIPEHWILWPFLVCPLVGFICSVVGTLIR